MQSPVWTAVCRKLGLYHHGRREWKFWRITKRLCFNHFIIMQKSKKGKRMEGNKSKEENMSLEGKTSNSYFCFSFVDFKVPSLVVLPTGVPFSWLLLLTLPSPSLAPVFSPNAQILMLLLSLLYRAVWLCLSFSLQYIYIDAKQQKYPTVLEIHSSQGSDILFHFTGNVFLQSKLQ